MRPVLEIGTEGLILLALELVPWLPHTSICQGDEVSISSYIQKKKALEKILPLAPKRNISLDIY